MISRLHGGTHSTTLRESMLIFFWVTAFTNHEALVGRACSLSRVLYLGWKRFSLRVGILAGLHGCSFV